MKAQVRKGGISRKELQAISFLEMEGRRFFSKTDIRRFFRNPNEMAVYIHRLARKGRVVRIAKDRYYLIPIQAHDSWSEHPYILVDEMFSGKGYVIGGKSAAQYWRLLDQLPAVIEVFTTTRQGTKRVLGAAIRFRRVRRLPVSTARSIQHHPFCIATKKESRKWV